MTKAVLSHDDGSTVELDSARVVTTDSRRVVKSVSKRKKAEPRLPAGRATKPAHPKTGKDFGDEGTNKTLSTPKPDTALPEDLGIRPKIEKSPYTRG